MAGRPLYRENEGTQIGKLINRVEMLERRRAVTGFYEIKIFADDDTVTTGDGAFIFAIPYDLNRARLQSCNIFVTTVSTSGLVTVQLHNRGSAAVPANFDMLTTRLTIDAGEFDADTAATPAVIDRSYSHYGFPDANNTVYARQQIRIDVDTAGTGAKGLGVMLGFG